MVRILPLLILFGLFIAMTATAHSRLTTVLPKDESTASQIEEVLYVPNQDSLRFISFGYQNFLANVLWFNTISYFGKHYRSDHRYVWLDHMCRVVMTLDPNAVHVPEFCSLILAWEANKPDLAIQLLDFAIAGKSDYWRYYYLRGMKYAFFRKDEQRAQADFVKGSQQPHCPEFVTRLATKKLANLDSPESALAFLKTMVERATDPTQRAALLEHYNKTLHEVNIRHFEKLVKTYEIANGSPPKSLKELIKPSRTNDLLLDPFGGTYYLDADTGKVKSTSNMERINLFKETPSS